jgi:hypothetical protein
MRVRGRRSISTAQELIRQREAAIREALLERPMTVTEVVQATAVPDGRVRYTLTRWHFEGKISIAEWVRLLCPDGKYRVTPKFTAVVGYDAPPPDGVRRKGLNLKSEPAAIAVSIAIRKWFNA